MKNLLTTALLFLTISSSALAGTGGPDVFGYSWEDSAELGGPEFQWVEMTDSEVVLNADSADVGAWVPLPGPALVFYGVEEPEVMVSKNGYLTFSETDTGADVTNDCPLPAAPATDSGRRIAVLHDHLLFGGGLPGSAERGRVEMQYFATSPHPHHKCGVTVISWLNMTHSGDTARFSFQLLLFDNFDIIMQFGKNPENGSGSSTGLQSDSASGIEVVCDTVGSIPDDFAVLFEPPTVVVDSANDDTSALLTTLRSALLTAGAGSKIVFAPSLNGATIVIDEIRSLLGPGGADSVSIDASKLGRGITLDGHQEAQLYRAGGRTHFSKVDFLNGAGSEDFPVAGLVVDPVQASNSSALVTISQCDFKDNASLDTASGGGIFVATGGAVFLQDALFSANTAKLGGGVTVGEGAGLVASDCLFINNVALGGGGGLHSLGEITLKGCEFQSNTAEFGGGVNINKRPDAIEGSQTNASIEGCLFWINEAFSAGGGIASGGDFSESPNVSIVNSTFSSNDSPLGSAIQIALGSASASHSTFNGNESSVVAILDDDSGYFDHCIFAGSDDYFTGNGLIVSNGFNVADIDTVLANPDDLEGVGDVMLAPLGSYGGPVRTHALLPGSPAIDSGDPAIDGEPETDARGYSRIVDGRIDVGAYEFVGGLVVTTAVDEEVEPGTGLSLREAVRDVSAGGVVTFDPTLNGATILLNGLSVSIQRDMSVDASALADGITIDGDGRNRVMSVIGGYAVSLHNLDLVGGDLPVGGGAGLLVASGAEVSMFDSSVRGCTSEVPGGGIVVQTNGYLRMVDCLVSGNETTGADADGGGIYVNDSGLELRRTTVGNNVSSGDGGGIRVTSDGFLSMGTCTIAGNTAAGNGGGISINESEGEVSNTTISGNVAGAGGGGFYGTNTEMEVRFSTIANNRAASFAGGIVTASFQGGGRPTLTHCIVAANRLVGTGLMNIRALDQDAEPESEGYNLVDDDSFSNAVATDLTERVAYLAPLADYGSELQTHALLAISPAIDAGDPAGEDVPVKDGRGYDRVVDGRNIGAPRVDIGAHEAAVPVFVGDLVDVEDGVGQRSLRGAIAAVGNGGRILFRQSVNGGVIDLSTAAGGQGTRLLVDKSIQIDATSLSDGITISGGDETSVFDVTGGISASMHALRIEGGFSGAGVDGGGVRVAGNSDLLMTHCSLSGNRGTNGGGIHAKGGSEIRLQNVTLSGNTAQLDGGALGLSGAATRAVLEHCTLAANQSNGGMSGGVALAAGKLTMYSSVIADNGGINFSWDEPLNFTSLGYNLTDDNAALVGGLFAADGDVSSTNPNLNGLVDPGGWTKVHTFGVGSPVRNAGDPEPWLLPTLSSNGGLRMIGRMDIGAHERNGRIADSDSDDMPDYWENLYGFDPGDAMDAAEDADSDGDSNLVEFQNGTNPLGSGIVPVLPQIVRAELNSVRGFEVEFTAQAGVSYIVEYTNDMKEWTLHTVLGSTGANITAIVPGADDRVFMRVRLAEDQ